MRITGKGQKMATLIVCVAAAATLFGIVTMALWNWLMPVLFHLPQITFAQAVGLVLLSKILLGGIHRHGPRPFGGSPWKRRLKARMEAMTPDERERFRAGLRARWGCGADHQKAESPEARGQSAIQAD